MIVTCGRATKLAIHPSNLAIHYSKKLPFPQTVEIEAESSRYFIILVKIRLHVTLTSRRFWEYPLSFQESFLPPKEKKVKHEIIIRK